MSFGAFIRSERLNRGIAQKVLAGQVGIAPDHLGKIERGKYPPPSPDTVRRIAQALKLDEGQMLTLADESRPPARERVYTEESRRRISEANLERIFSEEHLQRLSEARQRFLERTGQKKEKKMPRPKSIATECGFCGDLGPEEQKTTIRYEDEQASFGLCPRCFRDWQAKPDGAVIVEEKIA